MNHDILKVRVEEACNKIAEHGIDNCEDKEVTLACFGMLMFNGMESIKIALNKAIWAFVGTMVSILISIILVLIFL